MLKCSQIELFSEYQGFGNDTSIWRYVNQHWRAWFPALGSYKNFTKHSANLLAVKERIFAELSRPDMQDNYYAVDGIPLGICKFARAKRCKLFPETACFGYCAAKKETYYGFKGLLVIANDGRVRGFNLTPANCDERLALTDMDSPMQGHMLGDKGFIGASFTQEMAARGIAMHTPLRGNMQDPRPKSFLKTIMNKRRYIESVIQKLCDQFSLTELKARNRYTLSARIYRKLIAFNLAVTFHGSTRMLES